MTKNPSKYWGLSASDIAELSSTQLRELCSSPPEKLGVKTLRSIGHKKMPLMSLVRKTCIDCTAGSYSTIRNCEMTSCMFWPYRIGTNPFRKGRELSDV